MCFMEAAVKIQNPCICSLSFMLETKFVLGGGGKETGHGENKPLHLTMQERAKVMSSESV